MNAQITPKNANLFNCKECDFICSKNRDWIRHLVTRKHKYRTSLNISIHNKIQQNTTKNSQKSPFILFFNYVIIYDVKE